MTLIAPLEWRGPMRGFFHEAENRWIRGLRAENADAIGIEPVHTRVDSRGLSATPDGPMDGVQPIAP
jgi:hypothetical protein